MTDVKTFIFMYKNSKRIVAIVVNHDNEPILFVFLFLSYRINLNTVSYHTYHNNINTLKKELQFKRGQM